MIQVIERGIDILEFVALHGKEPVQLIKIAEHVNISQPTCANIVKTLVKRNYLENASKKTGYILGAGAYKLTGNLSYNQDLLLTAKPVMEELTQKLNETSLLGVLRNNKRLILHSVQSDQDLNVRAKVEADVFSTASGRVLAAYLSNKELDNLVKAVGYPSNEIWPGVQGSQELDKAIKKIHDNEMAQTLSAKHICGFAVPVSRKNQVIAALSIFLPESRLTPNHKAKIIGGLQNASKQIKEIIEKEF